jgi:hypothetical protein
MTRKVIIMVSLKEQIINLLNQKPGLTDREITDILFGPDKPPQNVNQTCRNLGSQGIILRQLRDDNKIGNFPTAVAPKIDTDKKPKEPEKPKKPKKTEKPKKPKKPEKPTKKQTKVKIDALPKDKIKKVLVKRLKSKGWSTKVAKGHAKGADIDAKKGKKRWIIEVKGPGSRQPMRVNYFLSILGEILQRMDDPKAKYSIALPDLKQYRGLWKKLPKVAKERIKISIIFVDKNGKIKEEK